MYPRNAEAREHFAAPRPSERANPIAGPPATPDAGSEEIV